MKVLSICVALLATSAVAATLEQLSLDVMTQKSTAIVRGTVQQTYSALHGATVYTHYQVRVIDRWKGPSTSAIDFAIPGGTVGNKSQTFIGAPHPQDGQEYVLFLWSSPSGLVQVIGLSQGLFTVVIDPAGNAAATRPATSERMLSVGGLPVSDQPFSMRVSDLKAYVVGIRP